MRFPMTRQSRMRKTAASIGCQVSPDARANCKCREFRHTVGSYLEDLHHFIAEMVDDLDGDATRLWLVEGAGRIAMQSRPCLFVDLSLQCCLERFVRVVRSEEV